MPVLTVVVASTRRGRVGPQVARWFVERAERAGRFEVRVADLADLALPFFDDPHEPSSGIRTHPHSRRWSAIVRAADAFVFVMPEYNAGFTAPLKNAIDHLYEEWAYKPVGLVSYGMTSAGLRAAQMIRQVLPSLRMVLVADSVSVRLRERVDAYGVLRPDASMETAADAMLLELLRVTRALRSVRQVGV